TSAPMSLRFAATLAIRSDFLHAQLAGVADLDTSGRVRRYGGQNWNLINQRGRVSAGDACILQNPAPDLKRSDQLSVLLLQVAHGDAKAKPDEKIQQTRPGGIEKQPGNGKLRVRKQAGCAQEEC